MEKHHKDFYVGSETDLMSLNTEWGRRWFLRQEEVAAQFNILQRRCEISQDSPFLENVNIIARLITQNIAQRSWRTRSHSHRSIKRYSVTSLLIGPYPKTSNPTPQQCTCHVWSWLDERLQRKKRNRWTQAEISEVIGEMTLSINSLFLTHIWSATD